MIETTRQFGSEKHLVGTFTEPDATPARRAGVMVLLTNAGVISRSGPHRINVRLARHFAAAGLRSLRWDMSGLGDSARPRSTLPMREQFIADTRAAMDEAQRRYNISRFVMIGFCSGAEVAYYTALRDERLVGVALFDLFVYPTWKTQMIRIGLRIRRHGVFSAARRLAAALIRHIAQRRPAAPAGQEEEPTSTTPPREEFAARLSELHARGTRTLILFSGEIERHNYAEQFRDIFHRFGIVQKVDYAYLRECDHVFTTAEGQQALISTTARWMQERFGST